MLFSCSEKSVMHSTTRTLIYTTRRLDLLTIEISLKNYAGVVDPVVL